MGADIDLINDGIRVSLIDTALYTVNLTTHEKLADILNTAVVSGNLLTGKSLDGTTFRADDPVFNGVPAGAPLSALIVYLDTGDANTSWLLYYEDGSAEWPITPDGSDITINWDSGVNGIFKL